MIESSTPAMKGEKTKYRLAAAMKECMKTTPVDAITVRQITERCGVTRQTFYRNFLSYEGQSITTLLSYRINLL